MVSPRSSHQSGGVLVGPEGLWDGPVSYGHTGLGVGAYVDELVTAMPRLGARLHFRRGV
jgi:hypothetical protein